MSPASQGALEVERYIGSCLISSTGRSVLQKPLGGCRKQEQQGGVRSIKQPHEPQCQNQFGPVGTWAGGAPLISMASSPRRNNQRSSPVQQIQQQLQEINHQSINEQQLSTHLQNRLPLSRLAVHTQGAPLILSGRFHNNRTKIQSGQAAGAITNCVTGLLNGCGNGNNPNVGNGIGNNNNISNMATNQTRCHPPPRLNKPMIFDHKKQQHQSGTIKSTDVINGSGANKDATATGTNVTNIDSLSIASDESSGSNNSENSLPRIIKPRKRRKKDRKPPILNVVNPTNTSSTNDAKVIDELQPTPLLVSVNSPSSLALLSNGLSEKQQQQPQQLKPYTSNSYDGTRYPGENYYKGHRRLMSSMRENTYGRLHPGNNCTSNSSNSNASVNSASTNSIASNLHHEVVDTRQQHQSQRSGNYAHRHVQVKVLDDNRNVILPVPVCQAKAVANYLRHNHGHSNSNGINNSTSAIPSARFLHDCNEPVTLTCHQDGSVNIDECIQGSLCQCHYCDPATFIWDMNDQNNYSHQYLTQPSPPEFNGIHQHHHHHHHHRYSQVPATVFLTTARPFICQEHANAIEFFDIADNPCLRVRTATTEKADGAAILRRSWSDPTSYFSDEIVPNRDVGVIGDRGQTGESHKGRSSWRGDASSMITNSLSNQSSPSNGSGSGAGSPGLQGPLEVSTEIVTSLNGHRDLEIKFYSSSPTSYTTIPDEVKSPFAFPDDDTTNDSEDFSDIWSYHESKLQRDFRTLLQAEE